MSVLRPGHGAFVHDAVYDPSGQYFATCSSDRKLKIFSLVNQQWTLLCEAQDHTSTILRIAWAHPCCGLKLATTSTDQNINVYKIARASPSTATISLADGGVYRTSKDVALDIAFSPRQHGFLLAVAKNSGTVELVDFSQRTQNRELSISLDSPGHPISSCGKVGASAVAWCTSVVEREKIVAVGASSGSFFVYRFESGRGSIPLCHSLTDAEMPISLGEKVSSISWAAAVGRKYQLVAVCSNSQVRVLQMTPVRDPDSGGVIKYVVSIFSTTAEKAQRVSWDPSGTLLGVACEAECVLLAKRDPTDHQSWKRIEPEEN